MTERMTTMQSTTQWARENGTEYQWTAALDNHEPTRNYAYGRLFVYSTETVENGIVVDDASELRDARGSLFLIDDGRTVRPYYVAGWRPEGTHLILHPFPTNFEENGSPRVRADDGRPVDFGTWMLGPRRAFHLKISSVSK